jgi:hypothetical protein
MRKIKHEKLKVYAMTPYQINKALGMKGYQEKPLEEVRPKVYHKFLPLFCKVTAEILSLHQPYNHKIECQDDFTTPFRPIYSLSRKMFQVLEE